MRSKLYMMMVMGIACSALVARAKDPEPVAPILPPVGEKDAAGNTVVGTVTVNGDGNGSGEAFYYYHAKQPAAPSKAAYLGLTCTPAQPALQKQLQLKPGVGLVVDNIEADGPAAKAGVKELDVLHKIDDQLMINNEQLNVLIRSFEIGREVKLTVIREGKPQTLSAKLVEREVKPMRFRYTGMTNVPGGVRFEDDPFGRGGRVMAGDLLLNLPGSNTKIHASSVTIADDRHKMTVTSNNGGKRLKVQDKSGKVVFDGPIGTQVELDAVPQDLRRAYDDLLASANATAGNGNSNSNGSTTTTRPAVKTTVPVTTPPGAPAPVDAKSE